MTKLGRNFGFPEGVIRICFYLKIGSNMEAFFTLIHIERMRDADGPMEVN